VKSQKSRNRNLKTKRAGTTERNGFVVPKRLKAPRASTTERNGSGTCGKACTNVDQAGRNYNIVATCGLRKEFCTCILWSCTWIVLLLICAH
jgi:hypothetical protein